jgi:DNA helicase HerA-like ATPase
MTKEFLDKGGVTKKEYVLGRKEKTNEGCLNIGRYYALDSSLGSDVKIDVLHPHVILICGKRGYGKSYTIGVFIEEIANLEKNIKENLGIVVFDTLGIYWTTSFPNKIESDKIAKWDKTSTGFKINLFTPEKFVDNYKENKIKADSFSIRVSELSGFHWCQLFNVKPTEPLGILLTRAVLKLKEKKICYSISDLLDFIKNDDRCDNYIKSAAENFLYAAESWGIFDRTGVSIYDFVKRGVISVLDISHLPNPVLKDIVASLIGEKIFEERVKERKAAEQRKMGVLTGEKGIPMVWMFIDEAQLFLPSDKHTISKDVFINEWMRQGRQPGLSLVMATQRPSALDSEVLSHSDIIVCHRLTAQEDIDALSKIRPTFMVEGIQENIKKIGDEKGVALIVDDTSESSHIIKIRPRLSWHGGEESRATE